MNVSVVIVTWNRCDDVCETLEKLKQLQPQPFEIIVVDNASVDDTVSVIEYKYPNVKVIRSPVNVHCEEGNNIGARKAEGDIILFLDSDAHVEGDFISQIVKRFSSNKTLGILEPRTVRPSDGKVLNEAENWPKVNTFVACVVAIRKDTIEKIGYRPGEYEIYGSEPDICIRTVEIGQKIMHDITMTGYHRESAASRIPKKYYYYSTRNLTWVIWRHYPILPAVYETVFLIIYHLYKSITHGALIHFFLGLVHGMKGVYEMALKKRQPKKRYMEARIFPGICDALRIVRKKLGEEK